MVKKLINGSTYSALSIEYTTLNHSVGHHIMKHSLKVLLTCLFFISPFVFAAENVHEYQLKNGLKLIVKEDHRAPVVIAQVWYRVGSSYEPDGITGISHALEHMMFRGSKNYSAEKFLETVSESGGQQNAFTYYDFTAYYEMLSADKLPIAFKLEADRMRNLSLTDQDFAKEIQVVMEERRMRTDDDPQQLTFEQFVAAANTSTPYHHTPIGWMSDLKNMTVKDLRNWYQTWYAPNNAVVVVVGDVNPEKVYQLAQEYFGPLKPSTLPVVKAEKEIQHLGTKTVTVEAPAKLPFLLMGYNVPTVKTAEQKWEPYALLLLSGILGNSDSSRLEQNLVRGKQIVSEASTNYDPYFRLESLISIDATPAQGHSIDEVKNAILNEIKQLQDKPVSEKELDRVKAGIIANKTYQEDSIAYQAFEIGSLESVGLPWQETDNAIKQIKAITPQQIQAVAQKYLIPEHLTVATLKPLPITEKQLQSQPQPTGGQYVR
jgi:zinc protease